MEPLKNKFPGVYPNNLTSNLDMYELIMCKPNSVSVNVISFQGLSSNFCRNISPVQYHVDIIIPLFVIYPILNLATKNDETI